MGKKAAIPDAWDDDWESQADKGEAVAEDAKAEEVKISKAERLAKHAETNRKLWESAYASLQLAFNSDPLIFLLERSPKHPIS